jgi:hypothetical protein
MTLKASAAIAAAAAAVLAAPAMAQSAGPEATYWVSASTSTGLSAGMSRLGMGGPDQGHKPKRPGLGDIMGALASGGGVRGISQTLGGGGPPVRALSLQLGSTDRPTGDPQAEHMIPPGLNMGASLPLVTPREAAPSTAEPREDGLPPQLTQHPKGRLVIYWGCGEHAAGPPIVFDLANLGQGKMPDFPMIAVTAPKAPSPGRYTTYGSWPNDRDGQAVPADASLVGEHTVHGDYSPDIHFHLGPDHDFMGPLTITGHDPSPGGGTRLTWAPVQGSTGYFAWMMGASMKGGRDNPTMVMWSSSMKPSMMGAMLDYLPPGEVRRLIAQQVVLPPDATECIVPSEVREAGAMGMLSMIAYGDEVDVADPPRPARAKAAWNPQYTVKVRFKSTTSLMMGMPSMGGD